jgi:hypothetical protein
VNCELSSTRRQGRCWSSGPTPTTPHACAPVDCPITWRLPSKILLISLSLLKKKKTNLSIKSSLACSFFKKFLRDRRHHHRRRSGWLCTSTVTRGWLWWALKLWSPSTALVAKVKMNHKNRRARSSLLFFYFYFFKFFISLKMVLKWRVMRLMMCQNPSASATMWPFTTQVDAGH